MLDGRQCASFLILKHYTVIETRWDIKRVSKNKSKRIRGSKKTLLRLPSKFFSVFVLSMLVFSRLRAKCRRSWSGGLQFVELQILRLQWAIASESVLIHPPKYDHLLNSKIHRAVCSVSSLSKSSVGSSAQNLQRDLQKDLAIFTRTIARSDSPKKTWAQTPKFSSWSSKRNCVSSVSPHTISRSVRIFPFLVSLLDFVEIKANRLNGQLIDLSFLPPTDAHLLRPTGFSIGCP